MLYAIHGKDTFRSNLELQKLISEYQSKNFEIIRYDFEVIEKEQDESKSNDVDIEQNISSIQNQSIESSLLNIKSHLETKSLFISNKLIILKNFVSLDLSKKDSNLV